MVRMLFLVDGYNITKADPATRDLSLQAQREALVARLRTRGQRLLGSGAIAVVFDGEAGVAQGGSARSASHPVEVAYTRGASADDAIVERAARERGRVCLVSSDRELAERVRAHAGATVEVRDRETVFDAAMGRPRKSARGGIAREAGLPSGANKITEELKDLWLEGEE